MSAAGSSEAERATLAASRREFIQVARSFWLIPEIIPPRERDDVALLYCFCRHLDDAVDEARSSDEARRALEQFRGELRGTKAARPLVAALLARAPQSGLPLACADFLLGGMESDLGLVRFEGDAALLRYAYQVSAAVGLMLAPLLGVRPGESAQRVVDLGLALQLSNIVLGVEGDARRGRVYLPESRLAAAGLTADDVLRAPGDARLLPVLAGLEGLSQRYYQSAQEGAALWPLRYRHGILLLAQVYRGAAPAPASPAQISLRTKLRGMASMLASAARPRTLGLARAPLHDPALHRAIAGWPGANPRSAPEGNP